MLEKQKSGRNCNTKRKKKGKVVSSLGTYRQTDGDKGTISSLRNLSSLVSAGSTRSISRAAERLEGVIARVLSIWLQLRDWSGSPLFLTRPY